MTHVYFKNEKGKKEIYISGHSGYSVTGSDIVCAGISALIYAYAETVTNLDRKDKLQLNRLEFKDGKAVVITSDLAENSKEAFNMLTNGLSMLEENYKEFVKIHPEWEEFQNFF